MTTIKIEVNTGAETYQLVHNQSILTSKPIILFATIHLNPALKQAFVGGAGQTPVWQDKKDYDDQIQQMMSTYDKQEFLIATAGGSITFAAATNLQNARFVSVVGTAPTGNVGNCYGGVNLSSPDANRDRVAYLVGMGRSLAGIGLLCNSKSWMNQAEEQNWQGIAGVNHNIVHAGNTGGHNNSGHYRQDLNGADNAIKTMIISSDPFFYDTREALIKACNDWVAADNSRCVCYPLDDYKNSGGAHRPTAGTAYWYGPALSEVYGLLGNSAAMAMSTTNPLPFSNSTDTWGPI